jgi:hypothetical protein
VAVFAVGTIDQNNPFRFLERMGQETGGQAWLFDAAALQPSPTSPVMLDLLIDQVVKAIKSAYRLEYNPASSGLEQRDLVVTVKTPAAGDIKTKPVSYRTEAAGGASPLTLLLAAILPLLLVAGGGAFYFMRVRPVRTDYYVVGHGPSAGHVPEEYLYTNWRPIGRGGRGYQLKPEDPHFNGLSKTHAFLRVRGLRRIKGSGDRAQTVGIVEAHAGKPSSGIGLNTSFVYNEISGVRPLSERPFQLQSGDLLILQPASRAGESVNGLPAGVYLRLGKVGATETEDGGGRPVDNDITLVESNSDKTLIERRAALQGATGAPRAPSAPIPVPPAPAGLSDRTQVGQSLPVPPAVPLPGRGAPGGNERH